MADSLDLDAYLDRIHWGGSTDVRYEALAGMLDAHVRSIPFENLDVVLRRPIRLDLPALEAKLVRARRGGYCFEHASLFAAVLETLGFEVLRHTARVVLFTPRHLAARTHMFLTVKLGERRYVLDPGFGRQAPRVPVPLVAGEEVARDGEVHWMAEDSGAWMLRTRTDGAITDCWVSTLEGDNPVDFEMANWWTSTHPASTFVNRIMLRAYTPSGRITVVDRELTEWAGDDVRTCTLADRAALQRVLRERCALDVPGLEHVRVPAVPEWS